MQAEGKESYCSTSPPTSIGIVWTTLASCDGHSPDSLSIEPLGHHGRKNSGGTNLLYRVLHCTNLELCLYLDEIHVIMKRFVPIQRIRLKLTWDEHSLSCYVVFDISKYAHDAHTQLDSHSVLRRKLFNIDNLRADPFDFIPRDVENEDDERPRRAPCCMVCGYLQGGQKKFCHGIGNHHVQSETYSPR